jgi:tripartite-type tricarboxylate transporter receptor subunit TctC
VRALTRLLVVGVGLVALMSEGRAQSADFSGKTLTIISSFAPGGGYDIYARLFAKHVAKHLPGRPTVVVRNMPGAGGLVGTNYLFNVAPKDGLTLGVPPQTVVIAQTIGSPTIRFDAQRFNWIGRVNSNVEVQHTWRTSEVKTIADAKVRSVDVAGTGPDSSSVVFPRLLNDVLGTKFKVVSGYTGVSMAALAMERGEVHGMVRPWAIIKTVRPEWLHENKINLLVQYAGERHHELKNVPAVVDLAENDSQRQIFALYASGSDIGRSIVAPPDVPADMLNALRTAFDRTVKDQAFLDDAHASGLELDPLNGNELQAVVRRAGSVSQVTIEAARKYSKTGQ